MILSGFFVVGVMMTIPQFFCNQYTYSTSVHIYLGGVEDLFGIYRIYLFINPSKKNDPERVAQ